MSSRRGSSRMARRGAGAALGVAGLLAGCSTHGAPAARDGAGVARASEVPAAALAACASQFGGRGATALVYRDASGQARVAMLRPDLSRGPHLPTVYFDERGQQVLIQANRPVVPGSPEDQAFRAERERVTQGLSAAESVRCGGE